MKYHCFRCGSMEEGKDDRQCPSCFEDDALYTCIEMGDILNTLYVQGTFHPEQLEIEEDS